MLSDRSCETHRRLSGNEVCRDAADLLGENAVSVLCSGLPVEVIPMDWRAHITADPEIMHGTMCFRGTRIPVSVVLDNLAAGETPARILDQYPSLTPEHIPAAIGYAAELARERIVPIPV